MPVAISVVSLLAVSELLPKFPPPRFMIYISTYTSLNNVNDVETFEGHFVLAFNESRPI